MLQYTLEYRIVTNSRNGTGPLYYFYCIHGKPVFKTKFHGAWNSENKDVAEQVLSHIKMLAPNEQPYILIGKRK